MSSSRVSEEAVPYGVATVTAEQRVLLRNVSWRTFEMLLADMGDNRGCRLAYDRGELEIMSPLNLHEKCNRLFDAAIRAIAAVRQLNVCGAGSMTCKREDLERGLEPDSSFYVQNEPRVRAIQDLDLAKDPPPDLMIEIDISHSSLSKFPICAALGVSEIWRYDAEALRIYRLQGAEYVEAAESAAFPGLALQTALPRLIARGFEIGETAALEEFREWVRLQDGKGE